MPPKNVPVRKELPGAFLLPACPDFSGVLSPHGLGCLLYRYTGSPALTLAKVGLFVLYFCRMAVIYWCWHTISLTNRLQALFCLSVNSSPHTTAVIFYGCYCLWIITCLARCYRPVGFAQHTPVISG